MALVTKVFDMFGGQQAAHGGGFDEQDVEIRALKQSIRALEHSLRTVMLELRDVRTQLDSLKAGGVVIAPVVVDAPAPVEAAPAAEAPQAAPVAQAEQAEPEAPAPSGLAAAARAAAEAGVKTSATLRLDGEASEDTPGFNGSNDPVLGSVVADGEVREADDGASFWGPVDNESARAKAEGMVLDIDRDECIGCGTCVEHIDTVYELNDDEGKAYVLKQEGPMDSIQDAIDACPVTCIDWVKPEDVFVD